MRTQSGPGQIAEHEIASQKPATLASIPLLTACGRSPLPFRVMAAFDRGRIGGIRRTSSELPSGSPAGCADRSPAVATHFPLLSRHPTTPMLMHHGSTLFCVGPTYGCV